MDKCSLRFAVVLGLLAAGCGGDEFRSGGAAGAAGAAASSGSGGDSGVDVDGGNGGVSGSAGTSGTGACPNHDGVLHPETGHCYRPIGIPMTWHDALKNCRELDGNGFDLVAPSSMDEILWIHSHPALTVVGEYWTGGNDLDVEGTFVWSNGEPWIYQDKLPPWDDGEPLGDGENCVQSYAKVADEGAISIKVLNDLPCNRLNAVICEWTPPASE